MKLLVAIAILFANSHLIADEASLPPKDLRATWGELEALHFSSWEIKNFNGWALPLDGGSKVFSFSPDTGVQFRVSPSTVKEINLLSKPNKKAE